MRIGIFSYVLRTGGTEKVIARLSHVWSALGHEIVFFTHSEPEALEFDHECVARECKKNGEWDVFDAKGYQEKYRLDLVVFNGRWNAPSTAPLVKQFKKDGVATMVILHHAMNNWAFFGGNSEDFDKGEIFRNLDCLVCVDKVQAFWWSRRFANVFYIPNPVSIGVDSGVSNRDAPGNSLVWVGRADDLGKRVELAIAAFRLIKAKVPDATLSVIGLKPRGKLVKYPGLEYIGRVRDTRPYLERAAVNLLTTLWEVTVPQAVLEAGAMGLPTVAMDLPVLRNYSGDGAAVGGLVLANDVPEMAEKVVELLQDEAKRRILGAAARKDVEKRADPKVVGTRWAGLLDAIAQKRLADYAAESKREYETLEVARALIDEIQRSEAFMVKTQVPVLNKIRRWQARWNHLKKMVRL